MSTSASTPVGGARSGYRHWGSSLLQLATRRRIGVSIALFTTLVVCDVLLWKTHPCDLFDLTSGATVLGELLLIFGLLLRSWAAGTLHKAEELTTSGPYQFVRNPLYLGSFAMMFGFAVLLRDWLTIWIVLGPVLAVYLNKVRQEERYLSRNFPDSWPAYARSTPAFFPNLANWPSIRGFSLDRWTKNEEYQALAASVVGLLAIFCWQRLSA